MKKSLFLFVMFVFVTAMAFAQAPFQGDNWMPLLGQRNTSTDVAKLLSYIGSNGNPKGIKATVQENILTRIDFYNSDNPWGSDIKKFDGALPKGIDFSWTIAQSKKALGEGFEFEGEVSGTYVLHKAFELNTTDGYQINIEFLSGRMNSYALIFQSGGAKKFAQDGTANKSGINGDDFLYMIKKNQYNKTYHDMATALGSPNVEEREMQIFANGGVEVLFSPQQTITTVYFFSGGQAVPKGHIPTFKPFTLPMPYGIKFGDTRDDIIKKAGPPAQDNGSSIIYKLDYSLTTVMFANGKVDVVQVSENKDYKVDKPAYKTKVQTETTPKPNK